MSKDNKVVILDFDGTLADVVPLMRSIYDDFAKRKGFPVMTEEKYQEFRRGSLRDVLKWMGVKPWQLPGLMREGRSAFHKQSSGVLLFKGIPEFITSLHDTGWIIYILSSNSPRTIKEILGRNKVDEYVHILKRPQLFGKASSIKKLVKRYKYSRDNMWMVGDETRDTEAGHKSGVNSVAVTWGLQHEVALKAVNPTEIVSTVSELQKFFEMEAKNTY